MYQLEGNFILLVIYNNHTHKNTNFFGTKLCYSMSWHFQLTFFRENNKNRSSLRHCSKVVSALKKIFAIYMITFIITVRTVNYASHSLLKRNIQEEHSQAVIETNLSLNTSDRSTVIHPDCVGIVLKQNNFAPMAQPSHEIFTRFAKKD